MKKPVTTAKPRTGRVLRSLLGSTAKPATEPKPAPVAPVAPVAPAPVGFRPAAFPATARVTVLGFDGKGSNPKRPGSKAARAWLAYSDAKGKAVATVGAALARFSELGFPARYARSALRWDSAHGFLKIDA